MKIGKEYGLQYIAHIRQIDGCEQTVQTHCLETAVLAGGYGEKINISETARLAALLHDIGKMTDDFNAYIHNSGTFHRGELDHSFAGAKYLDSIASHSGDKNVEKTAKLIGRVILSHHGLHDWVSDDATDIYQKRISQEKYYAEIMDNVNTAMWLSDLPDVLRNSCAEIIPIRKKLRKLSEQNQEESRKKEAFAFYLGLLERLLQSILIDADRTNTSDFMSCTKTEEEYDVQHLWQEMQHRMKKKLDSFEHKTDSISIQRKSISDRCAFFAEHDVHICKLIVPTGGGKTLSSLRFSIEYARRHLIDRIIYVAPFMSILEQNSDVLREIVGETAFLEHHSNMLAEVSRQDQCLEEYELRTEKWDTPVIATTMVQFLSVLFSGRTSAVRRMHRLSNAIIVIDEVQSIPLKCVYLFNLAMNFLSQICGSTVVLCSATQPPFELVKDFPILLDKESSMTGDVAIDFDALRRTKLCWLEKTGGYSYDEAADFCKRKFYESDSLLVIVNTKSAAKELFSRLKNIEGAKVFHLSTNMCPQHRREQIDMIKQTLASREPVICVTTQLIEAGVDVSFNCVVRSLAGMDNAAQAAGRCNRNGEYNYECPVYVIYLRDEKLGNLSEIKEAQSISEQMLETAMGEDFLSVSAMSEYYRKLYCNAEKRRIKGNLRNLLRYPLSETADQDIINLLSLNHVRVDMSRNRELTFRGQAFKKAGSMFEVIDSHTTNIIVPFNAEAEEIIVALGEVRDSKESARLLRQVQKYTVGIYDGILRHLEGEAAIHTMNCGNIQGCSIQVLDKRFYDADYGIMLEGGEHEILML